MRSRLPLAIIALAAVTLTTSGCLQWGDYAMSAECDGFSNDVREASAAIWGEDVSIELVGAADPTVWCGLEVSTGVDAPRDERRRKELASDLQTLVDEKNDRGVEVTVRYGDDWDIVKIARSVPVG